MDGDNSIYRFIFSFVCDNFRRALGQTWKSLEDCSARNFEVGIKKDKITIQVESR